MREGESPFLSVGRDGIKISDIMPSPPNSTPSPVPAAKSPFRPLPAPALSVTVHFLDGGGGGGIKHSTMYEAAAAAPSRSLEAGSLLNLTCNDGGYMTSCNTHDDAGGGCAKIDSLCVAKRGRSSGLITGLPLLPHDRKCRFSKALRGQPNLTSPFETENEKRTLFACSSN